MKRKSLMIIILFIIVIFSFLLYFFIKNLCIISEKNTNDFKDIYYINSNPIDIKYIIEQNTNINKSQKLVVEEIDLEYKTLYIENSDLPNGFFRTLQLGNIGKQNVLFKQEYENDELVNEEIVANNVTKNSVEKIIEIGTGTGYVKKTINKGDELFVCANNLLLKKEKNMESTDICQLKQNESVKILELGDTWYYVSYNDYNGYILKDGVSTYNPNRKKDYDVGDIKMYSKDELLKRLNFDMDVSVPSDLSLQQFDMIFSNDSNDRYDVFKDNSKYFYYVEEQYGINGVFLAAIGIHESAWGTSTISKNKRNLFGYSAYDRDPYNSASNFSSYAEGIDLVARVLVKNYLNSSNTVIFDGTNATGRYFSGKTISSVNKHYATDKNWANCVYKWMCELYNNIQE